MIAAGPEKTKDSLFLKQKAEKVEMASCFLYIVTYKLF